MFLFVRDKDPGVFVSCRIQKKVEVHDYLQLKLWELCFDFPEGHKDFPSGFSYSMEWPEDSSRPFLIGTYFYTKYFRSRKSFDRWILEKHKKHLKGE